MTSHPPPILRNPKVKQEADCKASNSRRGLAVLVGFRITQEPRIRCDWILCYFWGVSNMDCYLVQESDDFVVPNEYCGLDVIMSSTNGWSHWGASGFENNGLPRKYYCNTPAKENLTNLNSGRRMTPVDGIKVPRVHLVQKSGSSIASEDFLMTDRRMRTSDDLFHDLLDLEVQDSMQNTDDIFLDSFLDQDLMHLENLYESSDTTDPMQLPGNLRMGVLEDLKSLTDDSTRREDAQSFHAEWSFRFHWRQH